MGCCGVALEIGVGLDGSCTIENKGKERKTKILSIRDQKFLS